MTSFWSEVDALLEEMDEFDPGLGCFPEDCPQAPQGENGAVRPLEPPDRAWKH